MLLLLLLQLLLLDSHLLTMRCDDITNTCQKHSRVPHSHVLANVFSAVNQDFVAVPPHSDAAVRAPRRREGASGTATRLG